MSERQERRAPPIWTCRDDPPSGVGAASKYEEAAVTLDGKVLFQFGDTKPATILFDLFKRLLTLLLWTGDTLDQGPIALTASDSLDIGAIVARRGAL